MIDATLTEVLFRIAQQFNCWIGLREPNPLSLKWAGKPGYTAKPESCKAKSADNPAYMYAGLVVDPIMCPRAFTAKTLKLAVDTWNHKFLQAGHLPPGYQVEQNGPEAGLVKIYGKSIHADFDLMSIVRAGPDGGLVFTTQEEQSALFAKVEPALNQGFGARLVQHGAEFMWDEGLGARASEYVLWFGPHRGFQRAPSSMPPAPMFH